MCYFEWIIQMWLLWSVKVGFLPFHIPHWWKGLCAY
jgi:hypothetical protein